MLIWIDDELVDAADASVSVFDHGLTVGDGVFETVKVVGKVPFAMRRHLDRLTMSATRMGLAAPHASAVQKAASAVIDAFDHEDARLRITYTAGAGPLGSGRGDAEPTLIVAAAPLDVRPDHESIAIMPWSRNEQGALAGVKSTSYGENVVALARARSHGAGEAVFGDTQGRLSEGTGTNVFVVHDGRARTPTLASGCLAGVTRELVLEWSDAVEEDMPLSELESADEVFLTSTTRDVQAVTTIVRVDGTHRELEAGEVTRAIADAFTRRSAETSEP